MGGGEPDLLKCSGTEVSDREGESVQNASSTSAVASPKPGKVKAEQLRRKRAIRRQNSVNADEEFTNAVKSLVQPKVSSV